jgi:hypothetical protein
MTQPEALRLAEQLEAIGLHGPVAAELRRLHQFAEDQIGRATAAEAALQMTKATHALKIAAVETQRDALLEALRAMRVKYGQYACRVCDLADAAIKAVEEGK